jgi:hypothetical protein
MYGPKVRLHDRRRRCLSPGFRRSPFLFLAVGIAVSQAAPRPIMSQKRHITAAASHGMVYFGQNVRISMKICSSRWLGVLKPRRCEPRNEHGQALILGRRSILCLFEECRSHRAHVGMASPRSGIRFMVRTCVRRDWRTVPERARMGASLSQNNRTGIVSRPG